MSDKCLFCELANGIGDREVVWENEEFVCIKNKYPVAPVHVLVMPKAHISKKEIVDGEFGEFWGKIMPATFAVVRQLGLSETGYKLVMNGAGYNHFDHEHIHILGGTKEEPAGQT